MTRRIIWMLGLLAVLVVNAGCCRWCERWCGQTHYAPPAVYAAQPIYTAAPQACVPCCPVQCCPAPPAPPQYRP